MAAMRSWFPETDSHACSTAGHHWRRCSDPASPAPHSGQTSRVLQAQASASQPARRAKAQAPCSALCSGVSRSASRMR
eukprot:2051256-Lingulodinium_polyedra.AAC.1